MLLIAVCAALALAACGEGEGSFSSSTKSSSTESSNAPASLGPKPEIPQGPPAQKLIVKDLKEGTGAVVKKGDVVIVHYVAGIYETGEEIESAWVKGEPLGLPLTPDEVVPGWEKGLPGMRVGGRRELIFPATRKDAPIGSVPTDTLVYVVDVVGIQ